LDHSSPTDNCPDCNSPEGTFGCATCSPRLRVEDGGTIHIIPLIEPVLKVGRDPKCDLVLEPPWIAPLHARLELVGGTHRIVAAESVDGLLLEGKNIVNHVLQDGDTVRLPDTTSGGFLSLIYENPLAPPAAAIQHFATPPGKAELSIGRADADIVLDQPLVSRRHALLLWRDDRHVLVDLGSTYGTFINGQRVEGERPLQPDDIVLIGSFRLTYDGDSLDRLDQRGAIRIDAQGLQRIVGRGSRKLAILHDTTISIEPCEFVGIVGGSGSGKSTLLMALCGFHPADAGSVRVNGDDFYKGYEAYRSILGYVPQDDILHLTLPVNRALQYAARLRLPADTEQGEIEQRIDNALEAVDMSAHRNKRIDQLSGGQRKRISIASEMLVEPSLLFLDEPTSGLDPGLERMMMYTLRKLADGGRNVVLITHATANICQCDHIVFMAAGRLVFFGPPFQALQFFGVCEFADIYSRTEGMADPESPLVRDELAEEYAGWKTAGSGGEQPTLGELWERRFTKSLQHQKYTVERLNRGPDQPCPVQQDEKQRRVRAFTQSPWRQFMILTRRYIDLLLGDRRNFLLLLLQAPIIGALLALVSDPLSLTAAGRGSAKKLLFMLATVGVWFGVINAAREICKENAVTRRERLAGLQVGPYVSSKVGVLSLVIMVQAVLLLGVVSLKVEMPPGGLIFNSTLEILVTIVLAGIAGIALGLCISVVATTPDKATSLIPIVLVPQILFAGLMFNLGGVTEIMSWFTASRWVMDALGTIVDVNKIPEPIWLPLDAQYEGGAGNLLHAWGALVAQAAGFLGLASLIMTRQR